MPMSATARTLGQSDVFRSLDETEIAGLARVCGRRSYGRDEIVFLRGDSGHCMYVVESGSVAVSLASANGRDVLLAILGRFQSFGDLAVVDDGPRVATVTAREPTDLVTVPRAAVMDLLARRTSVATALLLSMAAMVRRLDEQACDASLLDLPRRVEKYLRSAADHPVGLPRAHVDGWVLVDLRVTQADLARQVGGSRQQVNRILMGLEAAGSIERLGHRVVRIRPDRLYSDDTLR
jgi:CRP-like cAMP-binding protein